MTGVQPKYLHAVVDMGSNGIRFSITDLHPDKARILPTVFHDRSKISLYDAQWSKGQKVPLPKETIDKVISALLRFSSTCDDFEVPTGNRVIIATEATRTAVNGKTFVDAITKATNFSIQILSQTEEAHYGALGIASSCNGLASLTMDLGGGSCQIGWVVSEIDGEPDGNGGISLPYGAAALSRLLDDPEFQKDGDLTSLRTRLADELSWAFQQLRIPSVVHKTADRNGGYTIRLTGGGFRGLGYRVMNGLEHPYPIPIVNGFTVRDSREEDVIADYPDEMPSSQIPSSLSATKKGPAPPSTFRVSSRRASQYPAVAVLLQAVRKALPEIKNFEISQGGLKEGFLWKRVQNTLDISNLPAEPVRASSLSAIHVATRQYAPPDARKLLELFHNAIPTRSNSGGGKVEPRVAYIMDKVSFLHKPSTNLALVNLMHVFSHYPKESASPSALHLTLAGFLAPVHGLSHSERALISLVLSMRYGLELPPQDAAIHVELEKLAGEERAFWARYAGLVLRAIGEAYPRGLGKEPRLSFSTRWEKRAKTGGEKVRLDVGVEGDIGEMGWVKRLRKLGKKGKRAEAKGVKIVVKVKGGKSSKSELESRSQNDSDERENSDDEKEGSPEQKIPGQTLRDALEPGNARPSAGIDFELQLVPYLPDV